ncbi:alkane 1-monooxygenase [Polycyclovorans algicola]|uniref:alkane 1-monooxygenase n=1 Tax=Polycyclovorans algicola TaxID=616992 RepID=UPI0004A75A81|nr:alkane 1-monooxygenase [Polycyclovorans algicola]
MDYLKYWTPVAVLAASFAGLIAGGNWVWVGIASFPVLALLDTLVGRDYSMRKMTNQTVANIPIWICAIGPLLQFFVLAWAVTAHDLTGWQMLGAVLGVAWMGVVPLVPASHELYHMRGALPRFVGHYVQLCYLDCTRDIGHVINHHIDVATVDDGDTAPRGTDLYSFTGKELIASTLFAQKMEARALVKRGLSGWNIRHRGYRALLALAVFHTAMFLIGGWVAVGLALAAQLIARAWVESFNYFQHYGLIRVKGSPIGRRHVWNHLGWFSRTVAFEITNHADHHLNSYQVYYKLAPHKEGIPMPSVFLCFLTALIPPLWHEVIIKPALKRWDLEFATAEERKLAAEQNRKAGWPDWQNEPGAAPGMAATVGA